jgi:rubrerythrin
MSDKTQVKPVSIIDAFRFAEDDTLTEQELADVDRVVAEINTKLPVKIRESIRHTSPSSFVNIMVEKCNGAVRRAVIKKFKDAKWSFHAVNIDETYSDFLFTVPTKDELQKQETQVPTPCTRIIPVRICAACGELIVADQTFTRCNHCEKPVHQLCLNAQHPCCTRPIPTDFTHPSRAGCVFGLVMPSATLFREDGGVQTQLAPTWRLAYAVGRINRHGAINVHIFANSEEFDGALGSVSWYVDPNQFVVLRPGETAVRFIADTQEYTGIYAGIRQTKDDRRGYLFLKCRPGLRFSEDGVHIHPSNIVGATLPNWTPHCAIEKMILALRTRTTQGQYS